MADLFAPLWKYNFAKLVVVDVSDDYRLMQPPMPSDFYPVVRECLMPRYTVKKALGNDDLVRGYLYDWHETPEEADGCWYVGVVKESLIGVEPPIPEITAYGQYLLPV